MDDYKQHLSGVLSAFVTDDMIRSDDGDSKPTIDEIILSKENMRDYWYPAVTHVSFDFASDKNYENLELLGDVYSKSAFTRLFMKLYPNQTQLFYTETSNFYTSNEYIAEISRNTLGLSDYIRYKDIGKVTNAMLADCFEAFCGALVMSGDRHYLGFGLVLIEYFIKYIYENVDVEADKTRTYGTSITQLNQIFKRLGLSPIVMEFTENNHEYTFNYFLTSAHIRGFNQHLLGAKIKQANKLLIGTATGYKKNHIKNLAANEAFEFLQGYGINTPWAINIKNKIELTHPSVKKLAIEALKKAAASDYQTIMFKEIDKSEDDDFIVCLLLGLNQDGIQESLAVCVLKKQADTKRRSEVIIEGHVKVLKVYLGYD